MYGATTTTGHPAARMSAAVAASPAYSYALTCVSYHGPSRRPSGSPAAAITAPANPPYTMSLSRTAAGGDRRAASSRAAVVLPEPGGPATTHTDARTRSSVETGAPTTGQCSSIRVIRRAAIASATVPNATQVRHRNERAPRERAQCRLADELDALVERQDLDQRPQPARVDRQRVERGGEQVHRQHDELDQLEVGEVAQVRGHGEAAGGERVSDEHRRRQGDQDAGGDDEPEHGQHDEESDRGQHARSARR